MNKFETEYQEVIDFYINEEKGTVTAVLTVPQDILAQEMLNIFHKASGTAFVVNGIDMQTNMLLVGTYRGVAYCHNDDTFDAEVGMKIAKLKALKAYYQDRKVIANRIQTIFEDAAERMAVATEHNMYSLNHIEELLEEF